MRDSFDILDGDVPLDTLTKAEAVEAYYDAYTSESLAYYDGYSSYWWVSSEEISGLWGTLPLRASHLDSYQDDKRSSRRSGTSH